MICRCNTETYVFIKDMDRTWVKCLQVWHFREFKFLTLQKNKNKNSWLYIWRIKNSYLCISPTQWNVSIWKSYNYNLAKYLVWPNWFRALPCLFKRTYLSYLYCTDIIRYFSSVRKTRVTQIQYTLQHEKRFKPISSQRDYLSINKLKI
jgi:hypothetical protein